MLDIHAHLQFSDFDADRDEVIARARSAGVEKMIIVGTDLETSRAAIALAEQHEFLFASVGVHPHSFNELEEETPNSKFQTPNKFQITNSKIQNSERQADVIPSESSSRGISDDEEQRSLDRFGMTGLEGWVIELREMAKHPKVVAIGECGLDYFIRNQEKPISDTQKKTQRKGFLAQMEIAKESGLPMIIHTRPSAGTMDAYEDVFVILEADEAEKLTKLKTVLHCYQGDTEITKKFLSLPNVYFSFAGNVTYPVKKALVGTKDDILETVKLVPLDRMFVETDCPYLAPQAHRGTRNEPSYVHLTATRVATAKGVGEEELVRYAEGNFSEVFLGAV